MKVNDYVTEFKSDPLKFLKEYIGIIIIVPTILGGLWQLIELSVINITYIRFFSLTQMIPDGLFVLLTFIVIALASIFINFVITLILENNKKFKVETEHYKYGVKSTICTIASIIFTVALFFLKFDSFLMKSIYFTAFLSINFLFLIYTRKYTLLKVRHLIAEAPNKFSIAITYNLAKNIFIFLVIMPLFGVGSMIHSTSLLQFYMLYNIRNSPSLKTDFNIIYVNDKYIFLQNEKSEQVVIMPFDTILMTFKEKE